MGLREGSPSWKKATAAGFTVEPVAEAAGDADLLMMLAPDEHQPAIYRDHIEPNLKEDAALAFAHGFNIHFQLIEPRPDLDVVMIAPKGPGHTVRSTYVEGGGCHRSSPWPGTPAGRRRKSPSPTPPPSAAVGPGSSKRPSAKKRRRNLFGEQTVLCGGAAALVTAGFETLVEAGYAPEMAYFECLHELS